MNKIYGLILITPIIGLLIAALLSINTANAKRYRLPDLPPVQYDKPFNGKLKITYLSQREIQRQCGGPFWRFQGPIAACAEIGARGVCRMFMPHPGTFPKQFDEYLLRHERGHCNGWGGRHPGARKQSKFV